MMGDATPASRVRRVSQRADSRVSRSYPLPNRLSNRHEKFPSERISSAVCAACAPTARSMATAAMTLGVPVSAGAPARPRVQGASGALAPRPAAPLSSRLGLRASSAAGLPSLARSANRVRLAARASRFPVLNSATLSPASSGETSAGVDPSFKPYSSLTIGVPKESFPGERRCAASPETVAKLVKQVRPAEPTYPALHHQ